MPKNIKLKTTKQDKKRLLGIISNFKKTKVLTIGDLILDEFIWGKVDRISPEAPVPVVQVERVSFAGGGSLNTSRNVKTLGGTVYPCGVLGGRDLRGRELFRIMKRLGAEMGGIVSDPKRPTTLKTRVIAHSQQMIRFDRERTNPISSAIQKKLLQFVRKKIKEIDCVIIEDYGKGVITASLLKQVIALAKKNKKIIIVDPKEEHFSLYKGITSMTPNLKEASAALNLNSKKVPPREIGKKLLTKLKLESLLLTLGEQGMILFEKNGNTTEIPTTAQEVFDVSGAGDTVIATFSLALASGARLKDAAVLANVAAGIVVGKSGTARVWQEQLEEAIKAL